MSALLAALLLGLPGWRAAVIAAKHIATPRRNAGLAALLNSLTPLLLLFGRDISAALLNGLTPLLLLFGSDISATLLDCLARCRAPFG